MADPVPVYQHETIRHGGVWSLSLTPAAKPPWGPGELLFYAFAAPQHQGSPKHAGPPQFVLQTTPPAPPAFYYDDADATVPLYGHSTSLNRTYYDTQSAPGPGWTVGNVMCNAFASQTPATIPIYCRQRSANPWPYRYFLSEDVNDPSQWLDATILFYALPVGYRVGDKAADIEGQNDQNVLIGLSSLLDRQSWVMIDLSAAWCPPCQSTANRAQAFVDAVNSQGLPLKLLSVLLDDITHAPSGQIAAEKWHLQYRFKDSVLHCQGDPNSDLRRLVWKYALANGSSTPGYPTAVLVDKDGIIRHYQLGADLDSLQSALASYSGQALTGSWPL